MNTEEKRQSKFWQSFNSIHIYDSRSEATFKAVIITLSWIGGVKLQEAPGVVTREIGAAFYLFSLALIMEFFMPLFHAKTFIKRFFPFFLSALNLVLFFWTSAILLDKPFTNIGYNYLKWSTIISLIIIWVDVATMCLIRPSGSDNIENTLKNIQSTFDRCSGDKHE